MKILLPLILSLLLSASCSLGAGPVTNADGTDWLETTSQYYIWPVLPGGPSGPLTIKSTNQTHPCLFDIVQEGSKDDPGHPFSFSPVKMKVLELVFEETDLNIMFTGSTICNESGVWTVEQQSRDELFVTSGGVEGNPGPETARNWFKIVRYMDAYKLVHCPSVCIKCESICRDLAIFYKDNELRLGLTTGMPVKVVFKKAI